MEDQRLIDLLRQTTGFTEADVSDERLIRMTEGTFILAACTMTMACDALKAAIVDELRPLLTAVSRLWRRVRLWNPRYFINPFYSPSIAGLEAAKEFLKGFEDGFMEATRGEG